MSVFSGKCVKRLLLAMLEKMKERWDGSAGRKGKRRGMPSRACVPEKRVGCEVPDEGSGIHRSFRRAVNPFRKPSVSTWSVVCGTREKEEGGRRVFAKRTLPPPFPLKCS